MRRGGVIVAVKADDEMEAEQAALLMSRHGAIDIEACATGWRNQGWSGRISAPEDRVTIERYAYVFGDYPGGAGRSTATRAPSPRPRRTPGAQPGGPYHGPERRRWTSRTWASIEELSTLTEELHDFFREGFRLLQGGEVAALLHRRPALDPGVGLLRERARRAQDLLREFGVAQAHAHRPPSGIGQPRCARA